MKIENDADSYAWFAECLGPEPQDWMKDVGLDWFDEELLGRPGSPAPRPSATIDCAAHPPPDCPPYTIESSAWLIQQNRPSAADSEDDTLPPPVLPSMIPGTRCFADDLRRIRKPYALGPPPAAVGLLVSTAAPWTRIACTLVGSNNPFFSATHGGRDGLKLKRTDAQIFNERD